MNLAEALGRGQLVKFSEKNGPFVSSDHVGVEIELEGFNDGIDQAPPLWQHHIDGSLRNGGVEFVFANPLNGADIEKALVSLEKYLSRHKDRISLSPRTSVHVHVNCLDMRSENLKKMIALYCLFEPMIFDAYAANRVNNHFCVPMNESEPIQIYANDWCTSLPAGIKSRNLPGRYSAFNLESLRKFGTIEFRHLHGEYRAQPLIEWINLILSLKKHSMSGDFNPYSLLEKVSIDGPINVTFGIFPKEIAEKLLQTQRQIEMLDNCRIVQNILLCKKKYKISEEVVKSYSLPKPELVYFNGEFRFDALQWEGFINNRQLHKEALGMKEIAERQSYLHYPPHLLDDNFYGGNKRFPKKVYVLSDEAYTNIIKSNHRQAIAYSDSKEKRDLIDWTTGLLKDKSKEEASEPKEKKKGFVTKKRVGNRPPAAPNPWHVREREDVPGQADVLPVDDAFTNFRDTLELLNRQLEDRRLRELGANRIRND